MSKGDLSCPGIESTTQVTAAALRTAKGPQIASTLATR